MERTLGELAQLVGGECQGPPELRLRGIASLDRAGPDEITFITRDRYGRRADQSKAGAFVVSPQWGHLPRPLIITADPYLAYAKIAAIFAPPLRRWPGISNQAHLGQELILGQEVSIAPLVWVGNQVSLGNRVTLMPGAVVADRVNIGADTLIYPNVTILEGCSLGQRVIVHSGTVIGSDGFGFAPDGEALVKIPQLGTVIIEDDVEIGANCTIDRGALGETRICRGVKIDNLVQVAHNVVIGENTIVVAQVGISGSTRIGKNVQLAGQVGLVGHIEIGDRVRIGAQSGVTHSIPAGQTVTGSPARPHAEFLRIMGIMARLPQLHKTIKELEKKIEALENATPPESHS
ncbi:MAG: UDP-3-O-(3-hydroxymyristoyl)glucosamine N-acyltransferase [Deltaproteobacteria bacterium]|nr:UDP-3-O-(3-hydroxymyristoyl)glucosamine N-acyltransferase [Deltaproteobacteria bacterium]